MDIQEVVNRLNEIAEDPDNELSEDTKGIILNEVLILEALQNKVLVPMVQNVKNAAEHLKTLATEQKTLTSTVLRVSDAAQAAQESLRSSGVTTQVCIIFN